MRETMSSTQPAPADRQPPRGHLLVLNRSFRRTLEAENKSPRTIEAYTDAVRLLASYSQAHGHPLLAGEVRRQHIQAFIADQLARWKPATAHNRYRGLHAFFKWAVTEGDLETNPMEGTRPPQLPEQPIEVIGSEHLARLLRTCEGRDFTSRRDTAVILLLVDTGMRRAECAGMTLEDVDLDQRIVWVLGKGRRPRALPIGRKTAQALDRYLRAREGHQLAHLPQLWIDRNGPMTPSGVYQVVHDRARAAGLPAMPPHQLRHAFATSWLAEGGNENELMLVAGWKSRTMIDRYTKATAGERARASHARLSPGDRL
jgi:site-specific recombinase XerD